LNRPVIELKNITKVYVNGAKVVALKGISLEVKRGEILVIMGPSGSGKTTLLNIMGTLDKPTTGRVIIDGIDVTELPEKMLYDIRLKKIGFVFQFFNLITTLTAIENVMLPMILAGIPEKNARSRARELLNIVGLGDRLNQRPTQLSGGQQQRVAIARALANDPPIVLMDEPTGNVDMVSEAVILRLIKLLNKYFETTFVIITHNPEVSVIADRIINIRGGKLYERGEIPRLNLEKALDEKEFLRIQAKFLEEEYVRLKDLYYKGIIPYEEYLPRLKSLRERIERIRRYL